MVEPQTTSHVKLKEQGVKVDIIIGAKLLKIRVRDFVYQETPITNENLKDASILCLCSCKNFCVFPVKELIDPDVLPACSKCNENLDDFIKDLESAGQTVSRLQAWNMQGVFRDEKQYSRLFLNFSDHSNSYSHISREDNVRISDSEMHFYKIRNLTECSALRGMNTKESTNDSPKFNYHCLCRKFSIFGLDVLNAIEPMGMCSTCAYELRYSLANPRINAATQKREFKYIWNKFLAENNYQKVNFRTIWTVYLDERRELRKKYTELHFKDFLESSTFILNA